MRRLFFILVFLLGLFLRLYCFEKTISWFGDYGRDVLIAKHLNTDNFVLIGPNCDGCKGEIKNSPFYYLVLMVLFKFFPSPISLSLILIISMSLSIMYFVYRLGKLFKGENFALILLLFISWSHFFVDISRDIWQPYFIIPVLAINFWYLLLLYKSNKTKYLYFTLIATYIGLNIHMSYLPVFVVFTFWMFRWVLLNKKVEWLFIVFYGLFLSGWLILISSGIGHLMFIEEIWKRFSINIYLNNLFFSFHEILDYWLLPVFWGKFLLIIIIYVGNLLILIKKKNIENKILFSLLLSFFLVPIYNIQKIYFHYLMPFYLLYTIALVNVICEIKNVLLRIVVILFLILIFTNKDIDYFYLHDGDSQIRFYNEIAKIISNDVYQNGIEENFCVNEFDGNTYTWNTGHLYYLLEDIMSKNLVKIGDYDNRFVPIYPCDTKYILCEDNNLTICYGDQKSKIKKIFGSFTFRDQSYTLFSVEQ